ncbi:MAG: RrF2 family transcriptional regulator [Clostridia bacterium]|jgi:Rrf2 family protein|nr:RrF2 family transcriptional regulator [Clostridiales bacterium]MDD7307544.1 RrF2 family transcriptional regulator [Eubacteriales bacterium]MDO4352418.1 RrF2 family transcriptional regulator [Clostridia bacterium]MDY2932683.1 RrF2 family transcriptional regulator [Anaerovoracaceae bacterium]MEE0180812.1 RrF2 family transcriptional regulator [Anaerovoracaceae bacterium]
MMISTKGRYALRVMIDLAEHCNGEYIPMKDVVKRQQVSQKYVERIMTMLSKANFVEAVHGKGGGYRLNRSPDEYIVGDILRLTEGSLAPVACLDCDAEECERADQCRTLPMWKELNNRITDFFDGITIADLMKKDIEI